MCGKEICEGEYGVMLGFIELLLISETIVEDLGFGVEKKITITVNIFSLLAKATTNFLVII
jgi:hypothetical protein